MANGRYSYVATIGLDANNFKNGMQELNSSATALDRNIRNLNTAIREGDRAGADTSAAEAQRFDLLSQRVENARQKVEQLRSIYDQMSDAQSRGILREGEWNRYATELARAETQLQTFETQLHGTGEAAEDTAEQTVESASKMSDAMTNGGKMIVATLGDVISIIKNVTDAMKSLVSEPLDAFSNYQQLVGGMETIFKGASDKMIEYADNAYSTIGISANNYMETVTGFSQSLIQSLGGDVVAATELANQALVDMADNANKMGVSMQSLQFAYQGFAKQNYTMLDNLKIGYGGTKAEMERLLEDANKINAELGKTTNYSIGNYADMIQAIHVIQNQLDITGTTAKEAATTVEGSMKQFKASFEDLKTAVADGSADIDTYADRFVDSFDTMLSNAMPVIENILSRVPQMTSQVAGKIVEVLPEAIASFRDGIHEMLKSISENEDEVTNEARELIQEIADAFLELLPELTAVGSQIAHDIIIAIASTLPELVPEVAEALKESFAALMVEAPEIAAVLGVKLGGDVVSGIIKGMQGIEGVTSLVEGLASSMTNASISAGTFSAALTNPYILVAIGAAVAALVVGEAAIHHANEELERQNELLRQQAAVTTESIEAIEKFEKDRDDALADGVVNDEEYNKLLNDRITAQQRYNDAANSYNAIVEERKMKQDRLIELDEELLRLEEEGLVDSNEYNELRREYNGLSKELNDTADEYNNKLADALMNAQLEQAHLAEIERYWEEINGLAEEYNRITGGSRYKGMQEEAAENSRKDGSEAVAILERENKKAYEKEIESLEHRKKIHADGLDEEDNYYKELAAIQAKYSTRAGIAEDEDYWSNQEKLDKYNTPKKEQTKAAKKEKVKTDVELYDEELKEKKKLLDRNLKLGEISEEEYYKKLHKLIGSYRSRGISLESDYYAELVDLEKKHNDKILKEREKAEAEKLKKAKESAKEEIKVLKNEYKEAETAAKNYENAVKKSAEGMSYDLFEMTDTIDSRGQTVSRPIFNSLSKKTDEIKKYAENFKKLSEKEGIPPQLLEEIKGMGFDERIKVVDELLKMSENSRNKYFSDYSAFQAARTDAAEVENSALAEQMKTEGEDVAESFANGLNSSMAEYGIDGAKAYIESFKEYCSENGIDPAMFGINPQQSMAKTMTQTATGIMSGAMNNLVINIGNKKLYEGTVDFSNQNSRVINA